MKLKCCEAEWNIWFNQECLKFKLFPSYTTIHYNGPCHGAGKVILEARRKIIKAELSKWYSIRDKVRHKMYYVFQEITARYHTKEWEIIEKDITWRTYIRSLEKKRTMANKLRRLKTQQLQQQEEEGSSNTPIFYRKLENLTDVVLTEKEEELLSKGLKYNPVTAVQKKDIRDLALSTEAVMSNDFEGRTIKTLCADLLRSQLRGAPQRNNEEAERLQKKLHREQVIVLKADKGNTTVLMKKEDYNIKTLKFIEDNDCVKLRSDPTSKYQDQARKLVNSSEEIFQGSDVGEEMETSVLHGYEMKDEGKGFMNGRDGGVTALENQLSKLCSRSERRVSFKTDEAEKGKYEKEMQKLYGEFVVVDKRVKREVGDGGGGSGGDRWGEGGQKGGGGHVCNSLFGSCASAATPVSLSEILADDDMGNGAPSKHSELIALKKELRRKDQMLLTLQREIHKLRSVLQQTVKLNKDDFLGTLHQAQGMAGQLPLNKKQGVSAESSGPDQTSGNIHLTRHEKDFRAKQLIKSALLENDFLKNLEPGQMRDIIDCMYSRDCLKGTFLIREGEAGSHLFVSNAGQFEVIKNGTVLGTMGPGKAFGELAILYNCTRTASIRVVESGEVWVLDRRIFKNIMLRSGLQRLEDSISFLQSVPLLHNLNHNLLCKIADSMQLEFYADGHYIVRQGASGDTFYIISCGNVKVTQRLPGEMEEEEVRTLGRGDYFGEQALLKEDSRTANVIALPPGVECLTLDRESFMLLIGDLSELQEKDYGDKARISRPPSATSFSDSDTEYDHIELKDLEVVATLGVGGFGRVELVKAGSNGVYALKCLKKCHIVETHQETHVFSERDIMFSVRSPFICRLYQTFKDDKYVYLLMEACLGGEVWSLLRDRTCFDDTTACFITSCVILAIEYLHTRNIVYRDLKPENLLFDSTGYVKLVDFGFAKKLATNSGKTWTFCGTPEYVAPEVIMNRGHDKSVDYWALGILMHELLTGAPPFTSSDPMKTYTLILKGIDTISFPRHVTRTAQNLIKRLCREVPGERLGSYHGGIADIKKHKWFQGFDWHGLENRTLPAPVTPKINGPTDVSNFDKFPKDDDIPPDEFSGWDKDF